MQTAPDNSLDESDEAPLWHAEVPANVAGQRLDRVLAVLYSDLSRSRLQKWVQAGQVHVNDKPAHVRQSVYVGDRITVWPLPDPSEVAFTAEPVPLNIVHQDADCFVLNKSAGLVVHPGNGNWSGTVLNGLLHLDPALGSVPRAGIVHRLDKDTTGLMVVARTLQAQTVLVRQLQDRSVKRQYVCLVWGQAPKVGQVDSPIGRDPKVPTRMAMRLDGHSKPALTYFQCLRVGQLLGRTVSLVQCRLATGRTHQIRVHLHSINLPLVADTVYVKRSAPLPEPLPMARQALHAQQLAFDHPSTGQLVSFECALPNDFEHLLAQVQWNTAQTDAATTL